MDGNFYWVTNGGGPGNGGTFFKITPSGTLTTLYSFCVIYYPYCLDGDAALWAVPGKDGNFYGTTTLGGANNIGTFFKITPQGALTTIYNFCAKTACTDGSVPRTGPILGSDGNLYGTTYYGGTSNEGTVFKITPAGALTTLHSFDGTDGNYPIQGMFQATNGIFFGETTEGGSDNLGTIYSLSVGLSPFLETVPTFGRIGTNVTILGNNLKGSTSVTFNGTEAVFSVASATEITATVPTGATTGTVKVTTATTALDSKVVFQVVK